MNDTNTYNKFEPKSVITVFKDKRNNYYLEQRGVKIIKGKTILLAPVPMSGDALKGVAKSYMKRTEGIMELGGHVAPHLLYGSYAPGKTVVVWYRPACERNLNFNKSVIKVNNSMAKIPATLYVVLNENLYVFALMTDERPLMGTKLYNAPFFNIYADGKVCLGTAPVGKIKAKTFEKEAERFERGFYMAEQNGGQSEKNCKTQLTKLWPSLIKRNIIFPSKQELLQHKQYKTLGILLEKVTGNKNIDDDE